jgi:uncharacterized OB-fold protein
VIDDPLLVRARPAADPLHAFFWASGADGTLRMLRCAACRFWLHPPAPVCPQCLSSSVAPEPLSGRGVVHTFTVNVQQWVPGQEPYVYAIVELVEQEGLRLTTNIVGCPVDEVHIGQAVTVAFLHRNDVHYPVFTP